METSYCAIQKLSTIHCLVLFVRHCLDVHSTEMQTYLGMARKKQHLATEVADYERERSIMQSDHLRIWKACLIYEYELAFYYEGMFREEGVCVKFETSTCKINLAVVLEENNPLKYCWYNYNIAN